MPHNYARVAVNVPVDKVFHYAVPDSLQEQIGPGKRVLVPFGPRKTVGFCVGLDDSSDVEKTKNIIAVIDEEALLSGEMLSLTKWMAKEYFCSWGEALTAALPAPVRSRKKRRQECFVARVASKDVLQGEIEKAGRRAKKRARILGALLELEGRESLKELRTRTKAAKKDFEALRDEGLVEIISEDAFFNVRSDYREGPRKELTLTPEQDNALKKITASVARGEHAVHLVFGVTAGGKTEVYLRAIREALGRGRQAIVLVPEISLTPQTVARFRQRFERIAVLHSHLTGAERASEWARIKQGEVDIVIGARSAVFAPLDRLGIVVIDEEHETTFKQESVPRYHAREVAVKRAEACDAVVVLGSATPSLESFARAEAREYGMLTIRRRVEALPLPEVEVVDMKLEKGGGGGALLVSRRLGFLITESLERKSQVMLFLNRRGFSTFLVCPRCGYVARCEACDIPYTFHRARGTLLCQYCDTAVPALEKCPDCSYSGLRYGGAGTEKIDSLIRQFFPGARVARMDSDSMHGKDAYERVLGDFKDGRIDILVGTQMIAKGLDYPDVTLVGIINADTALNFPDFRAGERTFQLLSQVAGRTGRGAKGGRVVIQTSMPEHPAITCAARHDYAGFAMGELTARRAYRYPPFGRLVRIIVRGKDEKETEVIAREAVDPARDAAKEGGVTILGPAACPITRVRGQSRFHLILKWADAAAVRAVVGIIRKNLSRKSAVQFAIDIDPVSML